MRKWTLSILKSVGSPQTFEFGEGEVFVGSDAECEVVLRDSRLSGRHLRVGFGAKEVEFESVVGGEGVSSDTWLDGKLLTERVSCVPPVLLTVGDTILRVDVEFPPHAEASADRVPSGADADVTVPVVRPKRRVVVGGPSTDATKGSKGSRPGGDSSASEGMPKGRSAAVSVEYILSGQISHGGMGRIYAGEDAVLRRQVAVKVSSVSRDGQDPRFLNEARVLAMLAHPNIVPVYNLGRDDAGAPFYSMKLVNGRTLQAVIEALRRGDLEARGEYTRERLLTVFRKVCDAVAFAHSRGVLHRDLKPENVMVGEFGEVLVMDWGLAKILRRAGEVPQSEEVAGGILEDLSGGDFGMTLEGDVMGTPQYMSPEQAEGRTTALDERSDIYSLGGILFAILTLRPPVEGKTLQEVLTKVKRGEVGVLQTASELDKDEVARNAKRVSGMAYVKGVPDALRAVTLKAMSREREHRYASVEDFALDIEAYQNGFATKAEHAGLIRQIVLLMKRNRAISILGAIFQVSAVVFTWRLLQSERAGRENLRIAGEQRLAAAENAARATESEKRALAEKDAQSRAFAKAQLALAEAAEGNLDAEAVARALAEVPRAWRDQTWFYLSEKLQNADVKIAAHAGMTWIAAVAHPTRQGVLLALQSDGWVCGVNLLSGKVEDLFRRPEGGQGEIIALSKDGRRVGLCQNATEHGSSTWAVEFWDVESGRKIGESERMGKMIRGMQFSPDGQRCLLERSTKVSPMDEPVLQWVDVQTGAVMWERASDVSTVSEISEDGSMVRVVQGKGGEILELDATSGEIIQELGTIPAPDPYGRAFVSAPGWNSVFAWTKGVLYKVDPKSGKTFFELRIPDVRGLGFLPDTETVATFSVQSDRCGTLQLWDGKDGRLIRSMPVLAALSGSWRLVTEQMSSRIALMKGGEMSVWGWNIPRAVATAGSNPVVVSLGDWWKVARRGLIDDEATLDVCDLRRGYGGEQITFQLSNHKTSAISSNRLGSLVATLDAQMSLFAVEGGKLVRRDVKVLKPEWESPHFELNSSGELLWTGVGVYETSSGKMQTRMDRKSVFVPTQRGGSAISGWISEDRIAEIAMVGSRVSADVEQGAKKVILLWDAKAGKPVGGVPAPNALALAVCEQGGWVAEGGKDMRIRIREAERLWVVREFRAHDDAILSVAWHPTEPWLVTASKDMTVRIWSVWEGDGGRLLEEIHGLPGEPTKVMVSGDGEALFVAFDGSTMRAYKPRCFGQSEKR